MSKDFSDINPGILAAAATLAVRKYDKALELFILEEIKKPGCNMSAEQFKKTASYERYLRSDILEVTFAHEIARLTGKGLGK